MCQVQKQHCNKDCRTDLHQAEGNTQAHIVRHEATLRHVSCVVGKNWFPENTPTHREDEQNELMLRTSEKSSLQCFHDPYCCGSFLSRVRVQRSICSGTTGVSWRRCIALCVIADLLR